MTQAASRSCLWSQYTLRNMSFHSVSATDEDEESSATSEFSTKEDDVVFFAFQAKSNDVGAPVVGIDKDALDAVPQSLLAVLAEKRWQREEGLGTERSNPIVVEIFKAPCKEEWNKNNQEYLAEWIRFIYECRLAISTELGYSAMYPQGR